MCWNVSSELDKPLASKASVETCTPSNRAGRDRCFLNASLLQPGVEIIEKGVAALTVQRNSEEIDSDDDDDEIAAAKGPLQMKEMQVRPLEVSRLSRMLSAIISWRTPETLDFLRCPQERKITKKRETCDDRPADQDECPVFLPPVHSITPHVVQKSVFVEQLKSK